MIDIDKILENSKYIKEELPEIIENRRNYTLEYRCVRKSKNFLNKIVHLIIYFIKSAIINFLLIIKRIWKFEYKIVLSDKVYLF